MKALVPIAPGFEEIEAVSIIDVLRRAQIDVVSAALDSNPVTGAHQIVLSADTLLEKVRPGDFSAIILPGGMPGSKNLMNSRTMIEFINTIYSQGGYACAVCAAPIVLGRTGILHGKHATCFPGYESHLEGAVVLTEPVVRDGKVITGRGPGCAIAFALEIVSAMKGEDIAEKLKVDMQVYRG